MTAAVPVLTVEADADVFWRADIQCLCRIIDCVTFKGRASPCPARSIQRSHLTSWVALPGSDQPIPIYTYDVPEQETGAKACLVRRA